ncbi:MAG: bifunctional hydroxymethylpyrimidine kinase/phosphomethylpyrimidine kinase [Alphaproteobacteria bacterium]|nr:bifunctional hydroxymethylpyrimidine kinase/phosphomethylpyrimidine kinase [Alphaproteobacteria bacterium]
MTNPVLLSLGSINADFQVRVGGSPALGETLIASDFVRLGGGKAANVAVLAQRVGVPARLLGQVGDDALGEQALGPLREAGVDLAYVSTACGCATAVSMVAVLPDGRKSIILANNANDVWDEEGIRRVVGAIDGAPECSVLVVDYEVPPAVARRAIEVAARRGLLIVIDPSLAGRADREMLTHATAVTPNPVEAEGLTGIKVDGIEAAARAAGRLVAFGIPSACVKLADGGCLVLHRGETSVVTPVPVPVVDTTGAGDAFAGALAVALMERRPFVDAACFATAASHLAVTAYGSQPAYPSRREIEDLQPSLLANIQRLT